MQKTILAILFFLHLGLYLTAQNTFHLSSTFATQQGNISKEVTPAVTIRNLSNRAIQLHWEIKKTNLSDGWQVVVCDHQCHTSLTTEHTFSLDANQLLHDFRVSFRPNGKEGIGTLELEVYDVNNPTARKTITFSGAAHGVISSSNQFEKKTAAPQIFPNPAIEFISIKDATEQVKTIEIYNVVGRKLQTIQVHQSDEQYDISRLPTGMYMIRMLDAKGAIVRTQRVSKYNP